ncbi:MAG: hypothetical protein HC915_00360 [Anaerolineae bacterium]|nr:hypothetical protein [Anaerolineae bacterium]
MILTTSLFHLLQQRFADQLSLITCSKATLVHISHTLEDLVLRQKLPALLLTGFQESSHWRKETERYRALAEIAHQVCVFAGRPLPQDGPASQLFIPLAEGDPLRQEWFVIILCGEFSVLLCGQDNLAPAPEESLRQFSTLLTFQPEQILPVLDILEGVIAAYRPETLAQFQAARRRFPPSAPNPALISRFTTDLLAYEERLQGYLRTSLDELQQVHQQLQQAQARQIALGVERARVTMLEQFVGDASHDLRTPITNLQSSLYLLRHAKTASERERYLSKLDGLAQHMQTLVESLLDMSALDQAQTLTLQPLQLSELLGNLAEDISLTLQERQQRLQVRLPGAPALILGHSNHLARAILNILHNASRYSLPHTTVTLSLVIQGNNACITIQDEGIGIAQEDQPRIFERFFRVDQARSMASGGTGLGLAITQKIIQIHGGQIEVSSAPGEGATFYITLPLAPQR